MIVSNQPSPSTPGWLRTLVLLVALALLPLGVAYPSEPDYEAVGNRLLRAVANGELTAEQAEAMMGKLAQAHFKERDGAPAAPTSRSAGSGSPGWRRRAT